MKKVPNPVDTHVGSRIRMRRLLLAMSQEKLAGALGLTFQQVQKYEKGTNRVSASRLKQIGETLGVKPEYFYEMLPDTQGADVPTGFAEETGRHLVDFLSSAEGVQLNRAFVRIRDAKIRRRIIDLVGVIAGEEAHDRDPEA